MGPKLLFNTLIDLTNNALASKGSINAICFFSEGYRNQISVTGSTNFKKSGRFFFGKSCSQGFGAPGCHPSTLIDPVNPAVASIDSVETKSMISEAYRTHRVVTGPMNFKSRTFFFWKIVLPEILWTLVAIQTL